MRLFKLVPWIVMKSCLSELVLACLVLTHANRMQITKELLTRICWSFYASKILLRRLTDKVLAHYLLWFSFFPQILWYFRPKYWEIFGKFFPPIVNSTNMAKNLKKLARFWISQTWKKNPDEDLCCLFFLALLSEGKKKGWIMGEKHVDLDGCAKKLPNNNCA
jgi:hypothetical protein